MAKILTFLLILVAAGSVKAQFYSVKGILQNEGKRPLRSATITMRIYNDTSIVFRILTDNKGSFEFKDLPAKIYRMTASYVGYDSLEQTVALMDSSKDLGVLVIYRAAKLLTGVVVTGTPPAVTQKADTLEYNASQYKVN